MSEPLFNIIFYGIIQPDKDRDTVLQNMASMFKTEPAKLAPYFAGGRKVIKSNVDELVAEKYRVALENIGLVIKIEDAVSADEAAAEKPQGTTTETQTAAPSQPQEQIDNGGISMADVGADVIENPVEVTPQTIDDISGISMAEVGADVVKNPVEVTPQPIEDISGISMAEVGVDMDENPAKVTPQPIEDISGISMAEVGADVVENPVEVTPQPIEDISAITMAEVGADIVENPKEKEKAPEPDISELSLE